MNQQLSSYRIFYVVANTGNISKAARELYISQPAISKTIHKLEESLGCRLFSRSSKGVQLTEEGALFYEHVKSAFETLTVGEEKLKQFLALGVGHLRIGVSTTLCKYVLLPYLREFIHEHPHIRISISCQPTNETLRMLEANQIDIGLIGKSADMKEMHFDFVEEIEDIFVSTGEYIHNLRLRGVEENKIFEASTLMLLDQNNLSRQYIDQYFTLHQITVSDIIEVSNMDLLIDFAKIGVGVACVIKRFVEKELSEGTLVELAPASPVPRREIGFVYANHRAKSQAMEAFIDFYRNYRPIAPFFPSDNTRQARFCETSAPLPVSS